ncbi:MAG: biotin/lipoyl-binding protein, partial [Methylocystis sp.]
MTSEQPAAEHPIAEHPPAEPAAKPEKRPMALIIGLVIFALLALGGLYYWWAYRNVESTDDAYTDGRAVAIAPRVSGAVVSLDVTDNQFVKKGQPLIHIDPRQYQIDRELAEGSLETAKHQFAQQQYGVEIGRKNFPAQLDQAQANLASAKANLAKAQS